MTILIVSKFHNETHDPKGQQNKIYTIVNRRETFYPRHTVPVTSCSEVKYVLKKGILWKQRLFWNKEYIFIIIQGWPKSIYQPTIIIGPVHDPYSNFEATNFTFMSLLNVPANLTFFKRSQGAVQNSYLLLLFRKHILFDTDLQMLVTMATILRHLTRLALITCFVAKASFDLTSHQTFWYVVACATSKAT